MALVLVSIMTLSFAVLVRYEIPISAAHEERNRAGLFARIGADIVSGTILNTTGDPGRGWVSQPGALRVASAAGSPIDTQVNLHSGVPSRYTPDAAYTWSSPAELNIPSFPAGRPLLVPDSTIGSVHLPLRWVYVRKDGSFDTSEPPETDNVQNPLVGRFAFWTDDESTKLNLNTAWKRNTPNTSAPNPFLPNHPSSISLSAIPGITEAVADQIREFITPLRDYSDTPSNLNFLNAVDELGVLDRLHDTATFSTALEASRFDVTAYNSSPEANVFNEPRIVLTTQERYAPRDAAGNLLRDKDGVPYFLDIMANNRANQDPGSIMVPGGAAGNLSSAKIAVTVNKLMASLSRADWPMVNGASSFQSKYYGNDAGCLAQVAVNIIDYVRSAESALTIVEPIRGIYRNSGFSFGANGEDKSLKGISRNIFITEVGFWAAESPELEGPNKGRYKTKFFFELHLPKGFGLKEVDLTNVDDRRLYFYVYPIYENITSFFKPDGTLIEPKCLVRLDPEEIVGGSNVEGTVLKAGGYAKIEMTVFYEEKKLVNNVPTPVRPAGMRQMRSAITLIARSSSTTKYLLEGNDPNRYRRIDIAPCSNAVNLGLVVDPPLPEGEASITTRQVDDPYLNNNVRNWTEQVAQTLGGAPASRALGKNSVAVPPQDTDSQRLITDISIRMPPPKDVNVPGSGVVKSVGELGFIHTGIQPDTTKLGVPWRTIRLQPQGKPSEVPDWALLDLFCAPLDIPSNAAGILRPRPASVAGRVNLNSRIEPYGNEADERPEETEALVRSLPLVAALVNSPKNDAGGLRTLDEAKSIADNLYLHTLALGGARYGGLGASIYSTAGEIAEIKGVADEGEASESRFRALIDHFATRGNVFTVYSVGQAIKQTPNGNIVVTAEQRFRTVIERYLEAGRDSQNRPVQHQKLRQVSHEYLTP